jgi:hypothetical protein
MSFNAELSWCSAGLWAGRPGFLDSRRGLGIFFFTTASRTVLGPTQSPIQWVPGALSLEVKRPVREADHSPPSSAEVKDWVELYLHSPNTPSWRGARLKNHRDNFTFTFIGTYKMIATSMLIQDLMRKRILTTMSVREGTVNSVTNSCFNFKISFVTC